MRLALLVLTLNTLVTLWLLRSSEHGIAIPSGNVPEINVVTTASEEARWHPGKRHSSPWL